MAQHATHRWRAAIEWLRGKPARKIQEESSDSLESWPVHAKLLLNKSEQRLISALCTVLPNYHIYPQVALSQLVGLNQGAPWSVRNRYSQLVADFVICDASYKPLLVVELDGLTHEHPKQAQADARKAAVLLAINLEILHINSGAFPTRAGLEDLLADHIPCRTYPFKQ